MYGIVSSTLLCITLYVVYLFLKLCPLLARTHTHTHTQIPSHYTTYLQIYQQNLLFQVCSGAIETNILYT
jgi:hypothetical protein